MESKVISAADGLLTSAYESGGRIPFLYTDRYGMSKAELRELNKILCRYGTLEGKLFEQWEWFQLNEKGMAFVESGGLKEEKRKDDKFWREHKILIIGIVIAVLTFLLTLFQFLKENLPSDQENIPQAKNWLI